MSTAAQGNVTGSVSVRYVGHYDYVDVRLPDELADFEGQRVTVTRGDVFVTTSEHAAALLEQDAWRTVSVKKGGTNG